VSDLVLARGAALAEEPDTLLQAELREVARYASILRAVADGCTDTGKVVGRVREFANASELAPYINKLAELRLLRVVRSLDATERERDRRYHLDDPFLAFWYRFVLPNRSALAAGHADQVWRQRIAPAMDGYMGDLFEWICREHARLHVQEVLPSPARTVGQVWAGDYDIDVAGQLLDGTALFGECKWWNEHVGANVLDHLMACAARTSYGRDAPGRSYLLYARVGFTEELRRRAAEERAALHLFTPHELLRR
jgi:AAA+ ATPase superfamily predicted ATPase